MILFWASLVTVSHILAAMGALALALWQFTHSKAPDAAARASATALGMSGLWAMAVVAVGAEAVITKALFSLCYLAWLRLLYCLFAQDERDQQLGPIRPVIATLALLECLQIAFVLLEPGIAGMDAVFLRLVVSFRLLFCIGALVLVHNLYVGASQPARQSLRWAAAALGLLWLYDLNFYTIAYLAGTMPALLMQLRGAVMLVAIAFLAVGRLRKESELRFRPSRSFAFQSFSLLVIGAYLVVMVLVSQGIAFVGREHGWALQLAFVVLASALALALLPSASLRGWIKVTIAKNLFQHRYDYRTEWMRFTQTIGRAGGAALPLPERIVQAVADITDSPSGLLLTVREEGGLALAARWQWPLVDVPGQALDAGAAAFFEKRQFILDLDDWRAGLCADLPEHLAPQWLLDEDQAWAIVPLVHYDRLMGLVIVSRPAIPRRLDWEDFDLLRLVGCQLASYLAERASQDALGEAQRFEEFNRRIAFVMHDIKNLASQLSLLARNAEKHADKAEFRADMILTLKNSTDKLQALLARLSRYGGQASGTREQVDLAAVLDRVIAQYAGKHEVAVIERKALYCEGDAESLEQALVHLVQNAIEASAPEAPVLLSLRSEASNALIEVIDSGSGMSAEFIRSRLFRPFQSSKPGGFGIGAFEARELVRAMGGRLDVESREGLGTRFSIRLPAFEAIELMRTLQNQKPKVA